MGQVAVVFSDLGNVVCLFDRRIVSQSLADKLGKPMHEVDQIMNGETARGLLRRFEIGAMPDWAYQEAIQQLLRCSLTEESFWHAHNSMFQRNESVIRLWQRLLRESPRVRLVAASDTDPKRLPYMLWLSGISFDDVVASFHDDVGVRKPDNKFFIAARNRVNTRSYRCLFVDDLQTNIDAAARCGMLTHRYRGPEELEDALESLELLK